jgi:hypothetical protein
VKSICSAALLAAFLVAGCEHGYRVYDVQYGDYHRWNNGEVVYYHQWANENHYDANRDFRHIPPEQQKAYWNWRHSNNPNPH